MAQLDPLLTALVEKDAQELVMSEGRQAALRLGGKLRPVSSRQLDRRQILRLLGELSDRVDAASGVNEPLRFFYEMRPGRAFECRLLELNGQLTARLSPSLEAPSPQPKPSSFAAPEPQTMPVGTATEPEPTRFGSAPEPETMPFVSTPEPDTMPFGMATEPGPTPFGSTPEPDAMPLGTATEPEPTFGSAPAPDATPSGSAPEPAPFPFAAALEPEAMPTTPAPESDPAAPTPHTPFEIDLAPAAPGDLPYPDVQVRAATPSTAPSLVVDTAEIVAGDVARMAAQAVPPDPPIAVGSTPHPPETRPTGGSAAPIERLLRQMVDVGASDLHLSSHESPMLRLHGEICRVEGPRISPEAMVQLLEPIMPERNRREFAETHDTDFAHEIEGVARFRANVFADRNGRGAVFRMIPSEILTAEQLGIPEAVLEMCELSKGLVLVTGPTGSGKSTTLAGMIDHINRTRADHIITIEDPVEFVHPNKKCLVNQREVHTHTQGFKRALRAALREDPDIVLVGEMRDLETIAIAIETAETGHLVFGTLHTTTAISTVDRIIDQFPADRQAQIRTMLSESLRGVVAQTLLKKAGGGRVAALEVLVVTPAISNLIREGKTFQIPSLMQTGRKKGMRLLNDALLELVKSKKVEPAEAYRKALDKASFSSMLKGAGFDPSPSVDG